MGWVGGGGGGGGKNFGSMDVRRSKPEWLGRRAEVKCLATWIENA